MLARLFSLSRYNRIFKATQLLAALLFAALFLTKCAHQEKPSPQQLEALDLNDMINGAINSHNPNLIKLTAKHIVETERENQAAIIVLKRIEQESPRGRERNENITASTELYKLLPNEDRAKLFKALFKVSGNAFEKSAWDIAAEYPSITMTEAIKEALIKKASGPAKSTRLSPNIAAAITANQVKDVYPLIRKSLMASGHPNYVKAMFELNPENAPDDALTYLALFAKEPIIAGDLTKTDQNTVLAILSSLQDSFPSTHHPDFPILFVYALSKNERIATSAERLLTNFLATYPKEAALTILQLSPDLQQKYLQRLSQSNGPLAASLSDDLRNHDPSFGR